MSRSEGFQIADVTLFNQDVLELYDRWKTPDVIVSDGGYGVSGFKERCQRAFDANSLVSTTHSSMVPTF